MDLTPEELELTDFRTTADGGFDPGEVREVLRAAAERMRALERGGVRDVADSVGAVLDQAMVSAEDLVARATTDAEAIRRAAEADAARIAEDAAVTAARQLRDAERHAADTLEDARAAVADVRADAERDARERVAAVLSEAQRRLDRMLAAERDVHDRLKTALADVQDTVGRVGVDQDHELALTIEDIGADPVDVDDAQWSAALENSPARADDHDR